MKDNQGLSEKDSSYGLVGKFKRRMFTMKANVMKKTMATLMATAAVATSFGAGGLNYAAVPFWTAGIIANAESPMKNHPLGLLTRDMDEKIIWMSSLLKSLIDNHINKMPNPTKIVVLRISGSIFLKFAIRSFRFRIRRQI